MDKQIKEVITGAVVTGLADVALELVFDRVFNGDRSFPLYWTLPPPLDYLNVDNALVHLVGPGALYSIGVIERKQSLKNYGLGGLLYGGVLELKDFLMRLNYMARQSGLQVARLKNNTYAGPGNPQPSPFAPPANPRAQLIVGCKSGGPTSVYKPNVSALPCAGTHASDQMLFV